MTLARSRLAVGWGLASDCEISRSSVRACRIAAFTASVRCSIIGADSALGSGFCCAGAAGRLTAAFKSLAGAGDGVTLLVHQSLDLERQFHVAPPVQALAGAALVGLELGKLRLPESKHVRLDSADSRYIADFEIQPVGNDRRIRRVFSGSLSQ